jgi:peptidyl-prolyl cis-trans isomerase SurA
MRKCALLAVVIVTSLIISSCSPSHSNIIVAEYGKDKITLGEFENAYVKNAGSIEAAKKDSINKYKNFLDLYVNFKMKLRDAYVRGFNTDPALKAELKDYKEKIGTSYLIEKKIVEPGIKKLYDQRKFELRVSHIMIRPDSSDEKAKELAYAIIDSLKQGKSWNEMVNRYSADKYSKSSGGDIYWITAGMIIPAFEEACYETKVGEVNPNPVKTQYGWHIIKVTDKRERIPEIRASHIFISFKVDSVKTDTAAALKKIEDIKKQLDNGADFAELAKKYSDDPGSKANNGDLGFFARRSMVKEFDEAAFNLKKGEISDIVKTRFGFHIIKLTDMKPYPSFEEDKEELKKIFKRTRYDDAYNTYVNNLKDKYNFKVNTSIISFITDNTDSTKVGQDYSEKSWRKQVKDSVIYSYSNKKVTVDTLLSHLRNIPEYKNNLMTEKLLNTVVEKDGANAVLSEEATFLDKTDPEFTSLMEDYKNGIYIFKLQDDEVWSKIVIDSTGLQNYYLQNKDKFKWPDRVKYQEIFCRNDSLINLYYARLNQGESFDSLAAKYTERTGTMGKANAGMSDFVDLSNLAAQTAYNLDFGNYSKPFKNNNGWSIVKLISKDPAHLKTFEEAKPEVSGMYQESESKRLESEYLSKLKSMYNPEINYDKLEEAFRSNQ